MEQSERGWKRKQLPYQADLYLPLLLSKRGENAKVGGLGWRGGRRGGVAINSKVGEKGSVKKLPSAIRKGSDESGAVWERKEAWGSCLAR